MIIDVANPSTIPSEIQKLITDTLEVIPEYIVSNIIGKEVIYKNDVSCAIENYLGVWKNTLLYEKLISLLDKHDIICYHSTKMIDKNLVWKQGLKTNAWESYKTYMTMVLSELKYSQEQVTVTLDIIRQEYVRKYKGMDRKSQLCFFTNLSLIDQDYAGYEQFCESIGGELARWALKENYSGLYEPLHKNGEAFIVKFRMPFCNIADYEKDSIAYQFIIYYAGKYFWDKEFDIEFDGNTESDVPKENIMEIIPYLRELDY